MGGSRGCETRPPWRPVTPVVEKAKHDETHLLPAVGRIDGLEKRLVGLPSVLADVYDSLASVDGSSVQLLGIIGCSEPAIRAVIAMSRDRPVRLGGCAVSICVLKAFFTCEGATMNTRALAYRLCGAFSTRAASSTLHVSPVFEFRACIFVTISPGAKWQVIQSLPPPPPPPPPYCYLCRRTCAEQSAAASLRPRHT